MLICVNRLQPNMAGTLSEGIVKINSKALEAAELKRLDKQEKEFIFMTHGSVKGRKNFGTTEL